MIDLYAQFNNHKGPMSTGEHRITFDVQPEAATQLYHTLEAMERHPQVILHIELMGVKEVPKSDDWNTNNRLIHLRFDEIAKLKDVGKEAVKTKIKEILTKEGIIRSSLSELTETQQLDVINRLNKILNEPNQP